MGTRSKETGEQYGAQKGMGPVTACERDRRTQACTPAHLEIRGLRSETCSLIAERRDHGLGTTAEPKTGES